MGLIKKKKRNRSFPRIFASVVEASSSETQLLLPAPPQRSRAPCSRWRLRQPQLCRTGRTHGHSFKNNPEKSSCGGGCLGPGGLSRLPQQPEPRPTAPGYFFFSPTTTQQPILFGLRSREENEAGSRGFAHPFPKGNEAKYLKPEPSPSIISSSR